MFCHQRERTCALTFTGRRSSNIHASLSAGDEGQGGGAADVAARALKDLTHETPSCREFVDKDNQSKVAKPIILFIPGGLKRSFDLCVNQ